MLSALILAYPEQLGELYSAAAEQLVARFREREESVKADVFHAYTVLLEQVGCQTQLRLVQPPVCEGPGGCMLFACVHVCVCIPAGVCCAFICLLSRRKQPALRAARGFHKAAQGG